MFGEAIQLFLRVAITRHFQCMFPICSQLVLHSFCCSASAQLWLEFLNSDLNHPPSHPSPSSTAAAPPTPPAFADAVRSIATAHDGRDAQLARDDGGMAGAAAAVGDDRTGLLPWTWDQPRRKRKQ